jgi:hypothetical protein
MFSAREGTIDGLPPCGAIVSRKGDGAGGKLRVMVDFLTGYVLGGRSATRAAALSRTAGASSAAQITGELHDLNERIDRLLLVVDALWSMLQERGYTDEDLAERIRTIDAQDGTMDGARKPRPRKCLQCDSMVEPGRRTCAFCGAEMEPGSALDSI